MQNPNGKDRAMGAFNAAVEESKNMQEYTDIVHEAPSVNSV